MKEKWNLWLPILLMAVFALTRWPGLMPLNFSAAYALAFCAGVYFPRRVHWWLPLLTLAISDFALNLYYRFGLGIDAFQPYQLINYVVYVAIIWLGTKFKAGDSWPRLVSGGILGAIIFYLVTNTAAWFFNPFGNPEYTKDLSGWIIALTKGTAGWPEAWTFFRNTLLSGGIFTGLFAGVMKFTASSATDEEEEPAAEPGEASAEESKAYSPDGRIEYSLPGAGLPWGEARARECIRSDTRPSEQRSPKANRPWPGGLQPFWLVALFLVGSQSAAAMLPSSRLATSQNRCNKLCSILPSGE